MPIKNNDSVNVSFKFGTYSSFLQAENTNASYDTNAFYNLEDIQALYLDNSAFYTTLFDTSLNNPYVLNLDKSNANPYAYTIYPKINELQIGNLSLNSTYLINNIDNFYNLYNAPNLQEIAPIYPRSLPLSPMESNESQKEYPSDNEYYPPTKFLYNYSPSSFYVFGTGDYTDVNFNADFNGLLTINYHSYYPVVETLNEEYSLFNKNGQISHTSFYHIQDTGELKLQGSTYMSMQKITQEEYDNLENNNEINPNILYIIVAQE